MMNEMNPGLGKRADRFSSKLLDYITTEASKAGAREKLKCVVDPVFIYLLQAARPYLVLVLVLLVLNLSCQGLTCYKLFFSLPRSASSSII